MRNIILSLLILIILTTCSTHPFTRQRTLALIPNSQLFPMAFSQYNDFLKENTVVRGTADAQMVQRVGERMSAAAIKWLAAEGYPNYFKDYRWEFTLIQDSSVNAWAMPGGKIVFYTGILPVTKNEAGLATVMGHEIAHAILNHGQQRMSAGLVQQLGGVGLSFATHDLSPETQALIMSAYGVSTTLGATLPFSRKNEFEADKYGTKLMAIAGYNPEEAVEFWQRMMNLSGGGVTPQFLSTHPSNANRIRELRKMIPEAKQKASEFGVTF